MTPSRVRNVPTTIVAISLLPSHPSFRYGTVLASSPLLGGESFGRWVCAGTAALGPATDACVWRLVRTTRGWQPREEAGLRRAQCRNATRPHPLALTQTL